MNLQRICAVILPLYLFGLFLLGACARPPHVPEKPWGPAMGTKGAVYACTTQTTDPSGGKVSYQFDWGDLSQSAWSGPVDGGIPYADTHTYTTSGPYEIRARAKNAKNRVSKWSEPFSIYINPGEGQVRWSFGYAPEDPEDSADFSAHTFAIGPEGNLYIPASDFPALICLNQNGTMRWPFPSPEGDGFATAATISPDGTIYIGTDGGTFYALNPNGTKRWEITLPGGVIAPAALGLDGNIYIQTDNESLFSLTPSGSRRWAFCVGGGTEPPVLGSDGTVYAVQDESLFALDPGTGLPKWRYGMANTVVGALAIDAVRSVGYIVDESGNLAAIDLRDGTELWQVPLGAESPSSPVLGSDGTVYISVSGILMALDPDDGGINWSFTPPLLGIGSTPAVSSEGIVYFLVIPAKKDRQEASDTLYAVNADGSRRWGCGLGLGLADDFMSAPKIDQSGYVYIGNGSRAWCIVGKGGPATSSWPMFQHDNQNTGRASQ
ncbi:MAG: PQQ-binding-like beta-propeller repeat protein [candidate division WOR-3 bacterium]